MPADQDTVKIEVLIELLIDKGIISREDYTNALHKKLGIPLLKKTEKKADAKK